MSSDEIAAALAAAAREATPGYRLRKREARHAA